MPVIDKIMIRGFVSVVSTNETLQECYHRQIELKKKNVWLSEITRITWCGLVDKYDIFNDDIRDCGNPVFDVTSYNDHYTNAIFFLKNPTLEIIKKILVEVDYRDLLALCYEKQLDKQIAGLSLLDEKK